MVSSTHPQAQFVPLSPTLDLHTLVNSADNFDWVTRVPREMLEEHSVQSLEQLVLIHVVIGGKPLVIENWGSHLPAWLFSAGWLEEALGTKHERVRDISTAVDIPMTVGHYLRSLEQLTNQFTPQNYRDPKRQRLYMKDIDTPDPWSDHLRQILPEAFFYLNDCIEPRTGGDGAIREPNEYGQMRFGKGIAPSGDLMSSLPHEMRAQNMMCYIGHEGTYTPAHREMCASLGHNIMVETSSNKKGEKAGSSIWFMTETKEREVVSEYFLSMLGHDIEVEKHFAQVNAWKKAPFNVWVVEQKIGDLILIPPLAPHQVWNRGTRTMKAAWNRTTVDTLELAIHEALPRARLVCRDEQYKNKAIIYFTLNKYHDLLQRDTVEPKMWRYGRIKQLLEDFKRLFTLYTEVLVSELYSPTRPREKNVEYLPYDSNVTCSYCRCNIFNRFLTCESCIEKGDNGAEDTYDVCMECYAMGRSCACISNLKWVEQWLESELTQKYEKWRNIVVQYDGYFDLDTSPQPLEVARRRYGKKPVAEICQEQLAIRPWNDINKTTKSEPEESDEPEVDDEGRIKKSRKVSKSKIKPNKNKTKPCHICFHHEWNWRLAFCTGCHSAYCYGVLYRAFDLMPQTVMENKEWKCPKCLKICSCGKCRKTPSQRPYSPKGTLLGHDTRLVADYRSIESLVDFSKTNLTWLRGEKDMNPQESTRMKRLKEKAEAEKAKEDTIDGSYLDNGNPEPMVIANTGPKGDDNDKLNQPADNTERDIAEAPLEDMTQIDPLLRDISSSQPPARADCSPVDGQDRGPLLNEDTSSKPAEISYPPNEHLDSEGDIAMNPYPNADIPLGVEGISISPAPVPDDGVLESSYPDPSDMGQNRMMGIGYYQQNNDTIDRILYDAPDAGTIVQPPITEQSGFLRSLLQDDRSKKRKRADEDGSADNNDGDLEFFTSKKQRRKAETRNKRAVTQHPQQIQEIQEVAHATEEHDSSKSISGRRPSRPGAGKRQVFGDVVDVDVVSTIPEQDLIVSAHSPRIENDLELAMKAMNRLKNGISKDTTESRALSSRHSKQPGSSTTGSPAPASKQIASGTRKGGRKPREMLPAKANTDSAASHSDSFVESIPVQKTVRRGRGRLSTQRAESVPPVTNTEEEANVTQAKAPAKKRGRPRRSHQSIESDESDSPKASTGAHVEEPSIQAFAKRRGRSSKIQAQLASSIIDQSFAEKATPPSTTKKARPHRTSNGARSNLAQQLDGAHDSDNEIFGLHNNGRQRSIEWRASEENPEVMLGRSLPKQGVMPPPKRRGRPPEIAARIAFTEARSPSPPSASNHMLSLKERLALKGKSGKIGTKKNRNSVASIDSRTLPTPVNVQHDTIASARLSANPTFTEKVVISHEEETMALRSSPEMTPPPKTPKTADRIPRVAITTNHESPESVASRLDSGSRTASQHAQKSATVVHIKSPEIKGPEPPVKKGPTVVRLVSSSEEESGSEGST